MSFPRLIRRRWLLLAGMVPLFLLVMSAHAVIRDGGVDPSNLGKGDWVWFMSDTTNKLGGNVASVTNETSLMLYYKSQGIRYMIVKAATNDKLFNGTYGFPQFNSSLVNIAHANGILIFGYNRSYGSNVLGEIAISDYVFNQGADGFVWDAEAEWESNKAWIGTNGPAKAWQLCSTVRSNWPTKFLAHAPFPIIDVHASFPYKEFGYWCDAVMPQIYHFSASGLKGSPSAFINWSDVNWISWQNGLVGKSTNINGTTYYWTNAIKPIAPIHDVYGPHTGQPLAGSENNPVPNEDVLEFVDYLTADPNPVTAGGYKGVSFWSADLHGPVQWAYIKGGTSGSFSNIVNNIVIDDPRASALGGWNAVKVFGATVSAGTYYGATGTDTNCFGTNYLYKAPGTGSAYVQYTPNILTAGNYDVYQWHVYRADASASVPFVINHSEGSTTVFANQQTNSGNWTLLGRFNFAAGTAGNIRMTDGFVEAGTVAIADGIKLVFAASASGPAAIIDQPQSRVVSAGQTASFSVNAGGAPPLSYQWRFNGNTVAGATDTSYSRNNVQAADLGLYDVIVTNSLGSITSAPASLAIETIVDNAAAIFTGGWTYSSATAGHYGTNYGYISTVSGAATANSVFRPTLAAGKYDVYVWHTIGGNRSTAAPWVITYNGGSTNVPVNQQVNSSTWVRIASNLNFAAGTGGAVTLFNNTPDSGKVVMADAVRFVNVAPLINPPAINNQPQSITVNQGANAIFSVSATGSAPLSYQWQKGASIIAGATNSTYTRSNVTAIAAGTYLVVITNAAGSVASSNAVLTVMVPPAISQHPQSQTVRAGSNITFTVLASGSSPLAYQWSMNGSLLPGATTSSMTLTNVQANQAGNYSVSITNDAGSAVSSNALLTVTLPLPSQFELLKVLPDKRVEMNLSVEPGISYRIEGSSNLFDWITLTNLTGTSGILNFIDDSSSNNPMRFYRARQEP